MLFPNKSITLANEAVTGRLVFDNDFEDLWIAQGDLIFTESISGFRDLIVYLCCRDTQIKFEIRDSLSLAQNKQKFALELCVVETLRLFKEEHWDCLADKLPDLDVSLTATGESVASIELSRIETTLYELIEEQENPVPLKELITKTIYGETDVQRTICILTLIGLTEEVSLSRPAKSTIDKILPRVGSLESKIDLSAVFGIVGSCLVTGVALALDKIELVELKLFDLYNQNQAGEKFAEITVVEVDESDIAYVETYPFSDSKLVEILQTIDHHNPSVIGFDIYRNLKVGEGAEELERLFTENSKIIGIEKVVPATTDYENVVPPPPALAAARRVAISDSVPDPDGITRRALLSVNIDGENKLSLGTRLAVEHLRQLDIAIEGTTDFSYLGGTPIESLHPHNILYSDDYLGGYQVMLNSSNLDFDRISLTNLLEGRFDPELIEGRVVLLGSTAASLNDFVSLSNEQNIPGVYLHAAVANQLLLSGVYGRKSIYIVSKYVTLTVSLLATTLIFLFIHYGLKQSFGTKFKLWFLLSLSISGLGLLTASGLLLWLGNLWYGLSYPLLGIFTGGGAALLAHRGEQEFIYLDPESNLLNSKGFFNELRVATELEFEQLGNSTLYVFQINNYNILEVYPAQIKKSIANLVSIIIDRTVANKG